MANWNENRLTVKGEPKALRAFVETAKGKGAVYRPVSDRDVVSKDEEPESDLCFNTLHPVPPEVLEAGFDNRAFLKAQGFDTEKMLVETALRRVDPSSVDADRLKQDGIILDGYHWQCKHWGTKWDADGVEASISEERAEYHFATAWSPPLALFDAVAKDFPALTFRLRYFEPTEDFTGYVVWRHGSRAEDVCHSVKRADYEEWGCPELADENE
jgi:hypothetical protein